MDGVRRRVAAGAALAAAVGAANMDMGAARASDVTATSRIEAVTVFPQGAEITRKAMATVAAGEHVIILRDLPIGLVNDSVRVEGVASGSLQIGAVDVRQFQLSELTDPALQASERKKLQDELDQLLDQRRGLEAAIAAANTQKQLIQNLANLPVRPQQPSAAGAADPDWTQLFTLIGDRLVAADKVIVSTGVEIRKLDKRVADVQAKLNEQPTGDEGRTEVKVRVAAIAPVEATFTVRYQVEQANWQPIYDARLSIGSKDAVAGLKLERNAIVSQFTGEPWDEVALALSTTRPHAGTAAPDLTPLAVDIQPPAPPPPPRPSAIMKRRMTQDYAAEKAAPESEDAMAGLTAAAPAPEPVSAQIEQATLVEGAFQAVYSIPGKQTIASGVGDKRVQIDVQDLQPILTIRSVPKVDPTAYLYAKWTLGAEASILPGQVALFRDGTFVGRGMLPLLSGGESHELGFGQDDKVRVKFADMGRKAGQTGIISTSKTDTQSFKITVKNLHDRTVQVRILDQVPISANDEIKVELASETTAPSARDVDDKRGVLAWDLPMAAGQESVVLLGYKVSWPSAKSVMYVPRTEPWPVPK